MRQIVFFLLLSSLFFFSCTENTSSTGPGITKKIEVTTSIQVKKPILADRFGCDHTTKLKDPALKGYKTETLTKDTLVNCNCSDTEIREAGYTYTGENPVGITPTPVKSDWNWGNLPWEWLLWLLALGLLIYFFYWLFNQAPERRRITEPQLQKPAPVAPAPTTFNLPEGYDLVRKGYVQIPEGSGYAPAGMSIVSKDQVVIPANGNYIAPRNEKEALVIKVTPMSETHITNTFSIPSNEGWPEREETTEETPKTE